MEYISIASAAQRLGITEKEVEKLIQDKKLASKTEHGTTTVTKESVYAYSGISTSAKQTKNAGGRPPEQVNYEKAAAMISMSVDDVMKLVASGHLEEVKMKDTPATFVTMRSIKTFKTRLDKLQPTPQPKQDEAVSDIDVGDMEQCLNDEALAENVAVLDESLDISQEKEKAIRPEETSDEEVFTMTKRDFYASLTVAFMRAELRVYRSMKSFERK